MRVLTRHILEAYLDNKKPTRTSKADYIHIFTSKLDINIHRLQTTNEPRDSSAHKLLQILYENVIHLLAIAAAAAAAQCTHTHTPINRKVVSVRAAHNAFRCYTIRTSSLCFAVCASRAYHAQPVPHVGAGESLSLRSYSGIGHTRAHAKLLQLHTDTNLKY